MRRRTLLLTAGAVTGVAGAALAARRRDLFAPDNLVAWCIVPFDAKRRGPEERAAMLRRLGFRRFAYDWRDEHLPTLDRELDALQRHRIRMEALWYPCGMEPEKEPHVRTLLEFLRRRKVRTQLWLSTGVTEQGTTQEQRIEAAVRPIGWVADEAARLGCRVALYNHGGWFGEPENQIAIIQRLRRRNVGLVYNFHHGHEHLDRFPALLRVMRPHLLALNINGMRREGPKILALGQGDREVEMLRTVAASGWRGPIGILGHREDLDAEVALRANLDGLARLRPLLR